MSMGLLRLLRGNKASAPVARERLHPSVAQIDDCESPEAERDARGVCVEAVAVGASVVERTGHRRGSRPLRGAAERDDSANPTHAPRL